MIETERLLIRPWRETDVDHYRRLSEDIGYTCFSVPGFFLVRDRAEAMEKVAQRMRLFEKSQLGKFLLFTRGAGELVGTCGIDPYSLDGKEEYELGYRLLLSQWENGYATEAARAMVRYGLEDRRLARVLAFALYQNKGSLQVIEKLRFEYLGTIPHAGLPHRLYEKR